MAIFPDPRGSNKPVDDAGCGCEHCHNPICSKSHQEEIKQTVEPGDLEFPDVSARQLRNALYNMLRPAASPASLEMIGKHVLVFDDEDGVSWGVLVQINEHNRSVHLRDMRRAVYCPGTTRGLADLASTGPREGSRITPMVTGVSFIPGVTAVMECSDLANDAWSRISWKEE